MSLHNLFIEPFITGHQFVYNLAAWFVPALFLIEVVNLFLRRLMGGMIKKEWFLTLLYLVIGISGILLAMSGKNTGAWLSLVRTMFFLPIYQFGVLYRAELERHDSWNGFLYFGLLFLIQMFLHLKGYRLVYEAVFCRDFTNPILPYVTAATGIAFWLRIARLISPAFEKNRAICFFGSHTYTVMLHHLTALMAAKTCFALLAKTTSLFPDFDFAQYKSNIWYYYFPDNLPQFRILFLLLAICLPLGVRYGWEKYGRKKFGPGSMC